jgi:hypothetical protein
VPTPRRRLDHFRVRFDDGVWAEEVERLRPQSRERAAATRARAAVADAGVPKLHLLACEASGDDGTRLPRCLKVYVPITERPPSERPYGFVFRVSMSPEGAILRFIAFGQRHPRLGTRSVYERAHKRLHGSYPDE